MACQNKKILLVAINSRFNHVSLGVRAVESYVRTYAPGCGKAYELATASYTINQPLLDVVSGIFSFSPDAVFFSVYIWNVDMVMRVITELRKVLPRCLIAAGGPEVSYDAQKVLDENKALDFIIAGEGERTVTELCEALGSEKTVSIADIKGLFVRSGKAVVFTGVRPLIENLDELPFPYDDGSGHLVSDVDADNSIIYYESSRGCPFRCSYCLSSIDKSVRFSSLDRVKHDMDFFLANKVRLVKFVDRTYNLNEDRYIAIWKYLIEHWNNKTTFHFEIAAQQLTDRALDAIQQVPFGCMQFEIGIQSTNAPTLEQVHRPADLAQIHHVLSRIPDTIHVHLDLIAGLPYETVKEFSSSFNYTIAQKPLMLQLGFLKILHGTEMETFAQKWNSTAHAQIGGYEYLSVPPYEVLSSPWVSYDEMRELKNIDNLVDNYYNSQDFVQTMKYLLSTGKDMFAFFTALSSFFKENKLFDLPHKPDAYFEYLYSFVESAFFTDEERCAIRELLKFDYTRRSKPGNYPSWYKRIYDKEAHRAALETYYDMHSTRDAYTNSSYESFTINPLTFEPCAPGARCNILFLYSNHHLTGAASKTAIRAGVCLCIVCPDRTASADEGQVI